MSLFHAGAVGGPSHDYAGIQGVNQTRQNETGHTTCGFAGGPLADQRSPRKLTGCPGPIWMNPIAVCSPGAAVQTVAGGGWGMGHWLVWGFLISRISFQAHGGN